MMRAGSRSRPKEARIAAFSAAICTWGAGRVESEGRKGRKERKAEEADNAPVQLTLGLVIEPMADDSDVEAGGGNADGD